MKVFFRNITAVAAVEAAIILPVLVFLIVGGLELGTHMLRDFSLQRALSNTSVALQREPLSVGLADANAAGNAMVDFTLANNYVCAQSYPTRSQAQAGSCNAGTWVTTPPPPPASQSIYFIALRGYVNASSVTTLMDSYIDPLDEVVVVQITINNGIPSGAVMAFDSTSCPSGWSKADGTNGTPDLRDRNIIGTNLPTDYRKMGGDTTYTMNVGNMPEHTHDLTATLHTSTEGRSQTPGGDVEFNKGTNGDRIRIVPSGRERPVPIPVMDPYIILLYCIKD